MDDKRTERRGKIEEGRNDKTGDKRSLRWEGGREVHPFSWRGDFFV
jgi:hypothetical protein